MPPIGVAEPQGGRSESWQSWLEPNLPPLTVGLL